MALPPLQDSPLDLLRSCHTKMRQFSTGLERVVAAHALADPRAAESAPVLARYFREALPHHAADEDESLTPRLLRVNPGLAGLLSRLASEHRHLDTLLPALCADLDRLGAGEPVPAAALAERAAEVVALLREHARVEEEAWFPLVEAIPLIEQQAIRREMAERRAHR